MASMVTKAPPGVSTAVGLLLKIFPTVLDEISKARGKPTKVESQDLIAYVRRLDERRVLFFPYGLEVVESCVASLDELRRFTDETLAKIENPTARAALGSILDRSRAFVDRWHGIHATPDWWEHGGFHGGPTAHRDGMADFFQDLGELRSTMKQMLELLRLIEPKIKAPNLLPEAV